MREWGKDTRCRYCGFENPDSNRFCSDCGSPLKTTEGVAPYWQKRLAVQTAYIFMAISTLLIIIGLGIKGQADALDHFEGTIKASLWNLALLFGVLGIVGFLVAGLAYLFSLPTPSTKKTVAPIIRDESKQESSTDSKADQDSQSKQ